MQHNTPLFQLSIDRLRSLCDVVMGAVFVVLVLNIDIPDLSQVKTAQNFLDAFFLELPALFSFVICFLVVAKCWQIHNLLFHHVKQVDKRVLWLTMFYLLSISFLVFSAGLHMRFDEKIIVIVFSLSLLMPPFLLSMLCARVVYAWKFDESIYLSEDRKRAAVVLMLKIFLIPAIAISSVLLTYVDIPLSYYIWSLMLLVIFV
ncbi:MAG: hypothetical protein ACD_42C00498G0003 [uncultured bacterium]|nr:MAG: hypothetical protein ACD_42C00498G0003 [uncultured bacterium]OGT33477.1 MAG: hypothetical protein A3C44_02970 [Gammaproteobacteria bacterium RIFCSPHIGHO2_02_FULL_39_13]OGT49695.1 MAG: hypothetical protein A3E53_06535 [Gammaproteobacteria bacterium RIFCSPHIGHO2_12_FULL_39_24]